VSATIPVGLFPVGVAVTPDGSKVYVTNGRSNTVSVIDTATNTVSATIPVGSFPNHVSIQPPPRFAGVPGSNLSRQERLGSGDKVRWPRCRGCSLGVLHRAGAAGCHSGVLRRIAARGSQDEGRERSADRSFRQEDQSQLAADRPQVDGRGLSSMSMAKTASKSGIACAT
jgi:YVTN family beta-propeller protein